MTLYRKTALIEAIQYTGDLLPLMDFMEDEQWHYNSGTPGDAITIHTLEGGLDCRVGTWIAKGVHGEVWPIQDDIFRATYEAVEEGAEK
jgi:hypothetical protein